MQQQAAALQDDTAVHFNHGRTSKQLAGDFAAAAISASIVAPSVTIIDRSIVESIATRRPLLQLLRHHSSAALRRPGRLLFSKPLGIVLTLYAATYAVANSTDTLATELRRASVGTTTFVTTMVVNVPPGVWKDIKFAQIFGASAATGAKPPNVAPVKAKVPRAAAATFLLRDAVTIFGSFTMAPSMSAMIPDSVAANAHTKNAITQMTVPVLSQLVATPIHLLGLDCYNRQYRLSLSKRFEFIRGDLPLATLVLCIRIIPAFGIGCLANIEAREYFHRLAHKL